MEDDRTQLLDGPTGQYGAAAERLLTHSETKVVVMGHTHQARHIGPSDRAQYINTGTWADIVRVPEDALVQSLEGLNSLNSFLGRLMIGTDVRQFEPHYADIRIDSAGKLDYAQLIRVNT